MKKHNMKPIVDLMDDSIEKLKKLVPSEHQMNCNTCGQVMDLRDLSQVVAHEDCNGIPIDYDKMEQVPHNRGVQIPQCPDQIPGFNRFDYDRLKLFSN